MKKHIRDLVGFGGDLSSILAVVVPSIVLLVSGGGLAIWTRFPQHWMSLVGLVSVTFFVLGASLLITSIVGRRRLLGRDINADWIILSDQRTAHVHSRTRIDYQYRMTVRARKVTDTLRMRADWSGAGSLNVVSIRADCVPVLEAGSGNQDFFRIIAPFPVSRGKEFTFEFKIETDGFQWEQKPIFGIRLTHGRRKAGHNELAVIFDPSVSIVENRLVGHHFSSEESFPEIVPLTLDAGTRSVKFPFSIEAGSTHAILWEYR